MKSLLVYKGITRRSFFSFLLLSLFIAGSLVSPTSDILGNVAVEKFLNIGVVASISLILFFGLIHDGTKIIKPRTSVVIVLFLITWMSALSVFSNSLTELLPTLLRFLTYILIFDRFYKLAEDDYSFAKHTIERMMLLALVIGTFFGIARMIQGDLKFVNNAFRLAGNFGEHYLGYALFLYIPLVYFICALVTNFRFKLFFSLIPALYCFFMAQSRSLQVLLMGSVFCFIFFYKSGMRRKIMMLCVITFFSAAFLFLLIKTDIPVLARLKELLLAEKLDPSTLYRLHILTTIIDAYNSSKFWLGIGLGGFNGYFYRLTGESDVAAHNDYLLFFYRGRMGCINWVYLLSGLSPDSIIKESDQLR